MTELQILRNSLFDEIKRIKRGTADIDETMAIVKTSNAIIGTFNTELKTVDLILKAEEYGSDIPEITIFKDDINKKLIDYKEE